jgi:hypothetical protein
MDDRLSTWEIRIIRIGIFLVFLVTFGDYVGRKIWSVLQTWFYH